MKANQPDMRVLHVAESYAGGVKAAILDYVQSTPEFRHSLLYATRSDAPISPLDIAGFEGVTKMPRGHAARIRSVRVASAKADVVHAHSSFGGAYSRLALSTRTKRIIYTPHCYAYERGDLAPVTKWAYRTIERLLAVNTTVVAACSPREARLASLSMRGRDVVFVPNIAPDVRIREASNRDLARDRVHVVGAGRASAQKDPEYFRYCVAILRKDATNVTATWIGGDEALRDKWADEDIVVTGWLDRQDALEELQSADLYIHTALWEGFPVAVLESLSLGVPTVVREIPAFEGLDVPAFGHPSQLAQMLNSEDVHGRLQRLVEHGQMAVASFHRTAQRDALLSCYLGEKNAG